MLGFQDRARQQADKQAAQVRNAVALLNANREIVVGTGAVTFSVQNADGTVDIVDNLVVAVGSTLIQPSGLTVEAQRAALQTLITSLVLDIALQNTQGRVIWVRVTDEGGVNAILRDAIPASDAEWIP